MPYLTHILLLCLISGVLGADEQRCDLIGSLQCLRTFSSSHKFQVSSYAGDYNVNPEKLVGEMCTKLQHLYLCVGDRMLGCAPQYRLMYDTAVSSGRFVCNDGKQGFIDNFRCLVSNNVRNSSISCGGKILAVIQQIFSSPASVLPDLASKADELCIKSNDTLKCVIDRTTEECGAGAAAYVQSYMDTSISPLKSFFACADNQPYMYQTGVNTETKWRDIQTARQGKKIPAVSPEFTAYTQQPKPYPEPFPEPIRIKANAVNFDFTANPEKSLPEAVSEPEVSLPGPVGEPEGSLPEPVDEPVGEPESSLPEPVSESVGETKKSLPEPVGELENSLPEPLGKPKEFLREPVGEPESSLPEPLDEPEKSLPEPVGEPKKSLPEPVGKPEEFLPEPVGEPEKSLQEPVGEPTKSLPEPVGEPEESLPEPVGEPESSLPEPVGEPKNFLPEPVGEPEKSLPDPVNKAEKSLPEPVAEPEGSLPNTMMVNKKPQPVATNLPNDPKQFQSDPGRRDSKVRVPVLPTPTTTTIAPVIIAGTGRTCRKYCFRYRTLSRFTSQEKEEFDALCDRMCQMGRCMTSVCSAECGCPRKLVCSYTGARRRWAGDHWCNNLCRQGSTLCRQTQCNCRYD